MLVYQFYQASAAFCPIQYPVNSGATPVITGPSDPDPPELNDTLTCTDGIWTGAPTITFTRQWCQAVWDIDDELVTDIDGNLVGVAIDGATSNTYEVDVSDIGERIFCIVTGTNTYGSGVAYSNVTDAVAEVTGPATTSLYCWLKADAGTYQDHTGLTTPATADAAPIGTWADQSGGAHHWTQSTSGSKPTLRTNVINTTLPVIRFIYSNSSHLFGPDMSALTAGEFFIVVKATHDPGDTIYSGMWTFGSTDGLYTYNDGIIYDGWGSSARKTTVDPSPSLTSFRLYNVVSVSGEWTSFLDGTQLYTTATNTVSHSAVPRLGSNTSTYFDGDIAEVVIYSAKCSPADKATTKGYLASKYGLTIA